MQLYKLTVVALLLAARTGRSEIVVATSRPDELTSRLVDDLVNIVTSCYKDINGIGIAGNDIGIDSLITKLSVQHLIPVALIGNVLTLEDSPPDVPVQFRHKLKMFIIDVNTWEQFLALITKDIKYSIWWDHMALFFVLDPSPKCLKSINFMYLCWQSNVLNVKTICRDHTAGAFIFNYNPFTSWAPPPWKIDKIVLTRKNQPFTLFNQTYPENDAICTNLDFEKRKDLGRHTIQIQGPSLKDWTQNRKMYAIARYQYLSVVDNIFHTLFQTLNARGKFDGQTELEDITSQDMIKNARWLPYTWNTTTNVLITYPHEQVGLVIVTQFRGYKTQLNKILTVIDAYSQYGMGVVYLITLIFLKVFVRQALGPALLNLVRITCDTGFENIPINTSSRAYLTCLLFFAVTMQGIFQGNLASLLTQNMPHKNVDTQEELVDLGIKKIYGYWTFQSILLEELKNSYVEENDSEECMKRVAADYSAACLCFAHGDNLDLIKKYNLYMSREPISVIYLGFAIRWNWPLEERVNEVIARMVEASILESWDVKCNPLQLSDYQSDEMVNTDQVIKIIELHEMRFAFVILGIGLACATIAFIGELATVYEWPFSIRTARRHNRDGRIYSRIRFKIDPSNITNIPSR